ncbi:MAG: ABC transporter substrate-binding protein [Clostridiales bacterium]|nr:ABC transporter substrate-binding protein [Clostridiales bacterium]
MIKRMMLCVLAVMVFMTGTFAIAEEPAANESKEVVIGATTQMAGYFFTDLWSANTADMDVRALLHGYSTVAVGNSGIYQIDETAIANVEVKDDEAGNRTYEFSINPELKYNDGTPVTVQDYLFSVLMLSSPAMEELGAAKGGYPQLVGYEAYYAGESAAFSGVRMIDEDTFALTIDNSYLPYFYEMMYVNVTPYPMAVLAPEYAVKDDGEGAYIAYIGETEAPELADVLAKTVLGDAGYLYAPAVTSGPYTLTGFDAATGTATFEKNEYYLGNYEGALPKIDAITFVKVTNDQIVEKLMNGEIDIANKITDGDIVDELLPEIYAEEGILDSNAYLRSGYGFLAFACEDAVTGSVNVRKAIAMLTDADAYVEDFLGNYGLRTYGHYGLGQWMAASAMESLDAILPYYDLDASGAAALLAEDGWVLDEKGESYEAGEIRHKELEDGSLLKLQVNWAALENNTGCAKLQEYTVENLKAAGFEVNVEEMSFVEMTDIYYRRAERTHNMFYLASNFDLVYDPYFSFHPGEEFQGVRNTTGVNDELLLEMAAKLRATEPGANEEYLAKWLELQITYAQILPTYPLYSNAYFDVFSNWIVDYMPNAYHSWASAIVYADVVDPAEQVEEITYEGEEVVIEEAVETEETVEIIG